MFGKDKKNAGKTDQTDASVAQRTHQLLVGNCSCASGFNLSISLEGQLHVLLLALTSSKRISPGFPKRSGKQRFLVRRKVPGCLYSEIFHRHLRAACVLEKIEHSARPVSRYSAE